MKKLLKKLAELAYEIDLKQLDEPDVAGHLKVVNEIDELIKELAERSEHEDQDIEQNLTFCPKCGGEGSDEYEKSPYCNVCKGTGFIALKEASFHKISYIKKRKNKWCVMSSKGKTLGCHPSRKKALQQLRAVEWSKANK